MRITSHSNLHNIKPSVGETKTNSAFLGKTNKPNITSPKNKNSDMLISQQELMQLATEYKSGAIDRKEVNRRFVAMAITNSIQDKLGERDRQKITDDIEKFTSEDHDFLHQITTNLSKLT